jgi:septation ring formation regulator EzrA
MFNPFLIFQTQIHAKLNLILHNQRRIMADIDTLSTALDSISTEVDKIATEQQTLIDELQAANQSPAVDLSGVIAKAQSIQTRLQAIDEKVPDAPVTEPTEPDTPSTTNTPAV